MSTPPRDRTTKKEKEPLTRRSTYRTVHQLVEEFLAEQPQETPEDQKRALEAGVRYAETHLATDPRCNAFLVELAHALDQPPIYLPWVTNRNVVTEQAYLAMWWEEGGAQLIGNREGLRYLARLLETLADSVADADHFYAEGGYELIPNSENLAIVLESNEWFRDNWDNPPADGEETPAAESTYAPALRDVDVARIGGVVINDRIPDIIGIEPERLTPVLAVLPWKEGDPVWRKGIEGGQDSRYRLFKLETPSGKTADIALNLDDESVAFVYREDLERAWRLIFQKH